MKRDQQKTGPHLGAYARECVDRINRTEKNTIGRYKTRSIAELEHIEALFEVEAGLADAEGVVEGKDLRQRRGSCVIGEEGGDFFNAVFDFFIMESSLVCVSGHWRYIILKTYIIKRF